MSMVAKDTGFLCRNDWLVALAVGILSMFLWRSLFASSPLAAIAAGIVIGLAVYVLLGWLCRSATVQRAETAPAPVKAPSPTPVQPVPGADPDPNPEPAPAPVARAVPDPAPAQAVDSEGAKPAGLSAARDGRPDDLKMIRGVGPKLESMLNGLGFYHFDQIASWSAAEVAWVDTNLKGFKGRVTRDDWVAQAGRLAAGEETDFAKKAKRDGRYDE